MMNEQDIKDMQPTVVVNVTLSPLYTHHCGGNGREEIRGPYPLVTYEITAAGALVIINDGIPIGYAPGAWITFTLTIEDE